MGKNYLVIDFETTGLERETNQVIEVGAYKVQYTGDNELLEIDKYWTYVKLEEGRELSDFIKEYTGITEDNLSGGVSELEAMRHLASMVDEDTVVVAQFVPFDFGYMEKFGFEPDKFLCTRTLTNFAEPNESASLGVTCERNGISLKNAHTALADAKATVELLEIRLSQGYGLYENYLTSGTAERPLSFIPKNTYKMVPKKTEE